MAFLQSMTTISKKLAWRRATAAPWGDGFEDDSFGDIVRTVDWDDVCDDELLRFYPRLPGKGRQRLVDHIERCLATLCWQAFGANAPTRRGVPADHLRALASAHDAGWSPAPTQAYLETFAAREIHVLDELLRGLQGGSVAPFESERAELLALHCGLHPAYFWPEAIESHQRFTTFGWVGVILRGRSAMMPLEVAEYLHEIGTDWDLDRRLAGRFESRAIAEFYVRQAGRRLAGRDVVVSAAHHPRPAIFGGGAR